MEIFNCYIDNKDKDPCICGDVIVSNSPMRHAEYKEDKKKNVDHKIIVVKDEKYKKKFSFEQKYEISTGVWVNTTVTPTDREMRFVRIPIKRIDDDGAVHTASKEHPLLYPVNVDRYYEKTQSWKLT